MSKIFRSITISQIQTMLDMQNAAEANLSPDADWRELGWPFDEAIMVECGEALDHYGYKWWKHTVPNMSQFHMELVDIWHFGMCMLLVADNAAEKEGAEKRSLASDLNGVLVGFASQLDRIDLDLASQADPIKWQVKQIMVDAVSFYFDPVRFFCLCYASGLHPLDVYKLYVAKNILNQFRQENGYKDGSYVKIWQGREDNEWLTDILNENASVTPEQLKLALADMYKLKALPSTAN